MTPRTTHQPPGRTALAFTLLEVLMAVAAVGVSVIAAYAGITSGISLLRMARENLRATQIMVEKMETVRLYNWDEICSNGFVPTNFQAPYFVQGSVTSAPIYYGTISIADSSSSIPYAADLKKITVNINWTSNKLPRQRQITTFVSRYGLQNYVY